MEYMQYYSSEDGGIEMDYDASVKNPNICGHCHNTGKQTIIMPFATEGKLDIGNGIMLTFCELCESTTIHFLKKDETDNEYVSEKSIPSTIASDKTSQFVNENFSAFVEIYNQAKSAEQYGLDKISGMGYRKAIEFLVSDYLLVFKLKEAKWVSNPKTSLNNKIAAIKSDQIKTLAKAISWIGNDETHYTKQNPEYGINNMKLFINGLLSSIDLENQVRKATEMISQQH
ncbi:DUF4145 domain-containing protein [Leuconostoc mesenteroides]|uniref:DUF4145 domain-containing protein n=1 Tax=Leuconostoc mesenteroides TaxID=1245 RepID=UPI000682EAE6|nr:DUF4145 domain-containing protein [Leuconostoc mesenteroides]